MSLPWVRLDANIASHDKMLDLLGRPRGKEAAAVYCFALGWSGGHGTDGHIPAAALPLLHGTKAHANALVQANLWELDPAGNGWWIRNYATRQQLGVVTEAKRDAQRAAASKTNCIRWHGPDCGCWKSTTRAQVRRIK
jgi:hypothetical protein